MIAGYYDGDVNGVRDWLARPDKVKGVGIMYTTWAGRYDGRERLAHLCSRAGQVGS